MQAWHGMTSHRGTSLVRGAAATSTKRHLPSSVPLARALRSPRTTTGDVSECVEVGAAVGLAISATPPAHQSESVSTRPVFLGATPTALATDCTEARFRNSDGRSMRIVSTRSFAISSRSTSVFPLFLLISTMTSST
eukprot:NODE_14425_length_1110_cov_2.698881.p2 GENE.NODE_14425_length_1110_cov_2.698881~~NODE_14425_length_1110_cov_2.698881.p2  ORF type:complete len:137 (-),score=15.56 NODE_14425_length_1110_cov_2.698881:151-561(-)